MSAEEGASERGGGGERGGSEFGGSEFGLGIACRTIVTSPGSRIDRTP